MVDMVSRIKLLFTSQGADKAAKETEKVGRAQTRLGQTSASTGILLNNFLSFISKYGFSGV